MWDFLKIFSKPSLISQKLFSIIGRRAIISISNPGFILFKLFLKASLILRFIMFLFEDFFEILLLVEIPNLEKVRVLGENLMKKRLLLDPLFF